MNRVLIFASLIAIAGCTTNPVVNSGVGAVGTAAVGCGIGAAVTAPLLGVGCIPGAIAGGVIGATLGPVTTPPPPPQLASPYPY
jgi:hypothetical protein